MITLLIVVSLILSIALAAIRCVGATMWLFGFSSTSHIWLDAVLIVVAVALAQRFSGNKK